jgi:hypothetical protein
MLKLFPIIFLSLINIQSFSQDIPFYSIHREESAFYKSLGDLTMKEYDSINEFRGAVQKVGKTGRTLQKRVFGYHPYWGGSNYLNYHWDLITDLCYFSYEVDPATGNPLTTHDWETSPAVDSALDNNVRVHLCVTLFSDHAEFFGNPDAVQTLINNVINLIQSRGAHGVNIDIEALPSSQGENFTSFITDLCLQTGAALPGAEVSIAAPAVNWSNTYNVPVLNELISFFMVMGYDYYWSGSSQAGPVTPVYTMTGNYNYNFSKTISYYQSKGVLWDKLIIGVPYYGRQWPTGGQFPPSATTGSGSAYSYSFIKNNSSGNYSSQNRHIEPNSLATYYSFNNGTWQQCFINEVYSMGKIFNEINRRGLAGIGIWALGYDDGYQEMWELIAEKFTGDDFTVNADTIFDCGGPAFDYYNNEDYTYVIRCEQNATLYLSFTQVSLEQGYDSLWIYDGPDTTAQLTARYSGDTIPEMITSATNAITLRFRSDGGVTSPGWRAVFDTLPVSGIEINNIIDGLKVFPNPAKESVTVELTQENISEGQGILMVYNFYGHLLRKEIIEVTGNLFTWDISSLPSGIYLFVFRNRQNKQAFHKIIIE